SHAPLHFDLSTFDLFASAAARATTCLVPPDAAMFPTRLVEWIREQGITVWYSVPSALAMMTTYADADLESDPLERLRLVLFAGEVCPIPHLRELHRLIPEARYCNLYGPTETNGCTYHEGPGRPAADDRPV